MVLKPVNPYEPTDDPIRQQIQAIQHKMIANSPKRLTKEQRQAQARERARAKATKKKGHPKRRRKR
jgi:hypothetical protein